MLTDDRRKPRVPVPAGVPALLGSIIHERTGIFFEPERLDTLLEKLEPLAEARHCGSFLDYYYLLKYEENGREDWDRVLDVLSVQETYFWREMAQVDALVKHLVPEWFQESSLPLRIWSAGSASGEEPYSIAIALIEGGWGNHPVEIYATDGSISALQKAQSAIYRENSFRALPQSLREKYFRPVPGGWNLLPDVARRVTFRKANLLEVDEINLLARSPVIFCRNVFIYFSAHAIRQTVAAFASRMPRKGCLFVGASESLLRMTADFELREIGGAFGYVRI
jgi:chemotaxis protein methyltransferase CheR